jgi:hypothetical protein
MTRITVATPAGSGGGGGGGASTPPGQAAHYIGTWDVAVAYAAGECVRTWDGAEFKLYQAKKATTGDDPTSVVASWAEVTTPIVMWGSENPNTTDEVNAHGGGCVAPLGSLYLHHDAGQEFHTALVFTDWDATVVGGVGLWESAIPAIDITSDLDGGDAHSNTYALRAGAGSGSSFAGGIADRQGVGDGQAVANFVGLRRGSGTGDAWATSTAQVADTAVGTATAGGVATHHASGEAHVKPTATATAAFNDVKADLIFTDNTEGPVIHDQSDGHTYRIISTAGVLSTVQVT